ncbi:MAG: hypothetical protein SX243_15605 [Acidobacteriota bacterium]|nr:hypothetical protein [Acidobacteriota bacterium]
MNHEPTPEDPKLDVEPDLELDRELDADLAEVARREQAAAGSQGPHHPDPVELLDYAQRSLDPQRREQVQAHLVSCPECAGAVLDFESFPDLESPSAEDQLAEDELTEHELERQWRALREAQARADLEESDPTAVPAPAAIPTSAPTSPATTAGWSARWTRAAAAALVFAAVGLGLWSFLGGGEEPPAPVLRADLAFTSLIPDAAGTERGAPEVLTIPSWAQGVFVLLSLGDPASQGGYRLEIVDAAGTVVRTLEDVHRDEEGTLRLAIERGSLPDGAYRIRVLDPAATTAATDLATYSFLLQQEP